MTSLMISAEYLSEICLLVGDHCVLTVSSNLCALCFCIVVSRLFLSPVLSPLFHEDSVLSQEKSMHSELTSPFDSEVRQVGYSHLYNCLVKCRKSLAVAQFVYKCICMCIYVCFFGGLVGFMQPRLSLNTLHSQGWPWPSDVLAYLLP